jgi:protease IV
MSETPPQKPTIDGPAVELPGNPTTIVIQQSVPPSMQKKWGVRLLLMGMMLSLFINLIMYNTYESYFASSAGPIEKFHSGNASVQDKIAILRMTGTVMPPFTERLIQSIQRAKNDDSVKGVVLVIDSPGGLVADSHQIYHRLRQLSQKKPMTVVMKRMAASGGYYIAMGAGPDSTIFAEPTTWTGSIGVIIPRYNAAKLAERIGVSSEPLKTGRFKDSLSPFRNLGEGETALWRGILDDAFVRFLDVIATNRKLMYRKNSQLHAMSAAASCLMQSQLPAQPGTAVEDVATGQIFTADQALKLGLIDKIGYLDEAIAEMKERLELKSARVVVYEHPQSLFGMLAGFAKAQQPEQHWRAIMNATVPRAMYYCAGLPLVAVPYSTAK